MRNLSRKDGSFKAQYGDQFYSSKDGYTDEFEKLGVSKQEYLSIVSEFNLAVREAIVEDGFEWNIFGNLGLLAVYKYRPEVKKRKKNPNLLTLPINPRATAELWRNNPELKHKKYVYYINNKTDGFICKPFYIRGRNVPRTYKNFDIVTFTPVYRFKSSIKKAIDEKNAHLNYFIFEPYNNF